MVVGFEDVWRPPVKPARVRHPETVLSQPSSAETRARLQRLAKRTPEVMVKVTGRTRGASHLQAHLDYITRDGELEAEDSFGNRLATRTDVRDLATDWSDAAVADRRRRANTPFSHSIILSMPAGTDALKLRDAARSFAQRVFAEQFDYLFVLHTDTPRPHVHLTVRSLGLDGARLDPRRGDLVAWRQAFAEALRDRGVEAEATPRRARGVVRKSERSAVRRLRTRWEAGKGSLPKVLAAALREAAAAGRTPELRPWEVASARRYAAVRSAYLAHAATLAKSRDPADHHLARTVAAFVSAMPKALTRRLALAKRLQVEKERTTDDGPIRRR